MDKSPLMKNLKLTDAQKDAIVEAAFEACMWYGWCKVYSTSAVKTIEDLKEKVEKITSREIEQYT